MSAVAVMAELVGVCRPKMADEGVRGRFQASLLSGDGKRVEVLPSDAGVRVQTRDQQVDADEVEPERCEANDRDDGCPSAAPAGR